MMSSIETSYDLLVITFSFHNYIFLPSIDKYSLWRKPCNRVLLNCGENHAHQVIMHIRPSYAFSLHVQSALGLHVHCPSCALDHHAHLTTLHTRSSYTFDLHTHTVRRHPAHLAFMHTRSFCAFSTRPTCILGSQFSCTLGI